MTVLLLCDYLPCHTFHLILAMCEQVILLTKLYKTPSGYKGPGVQVNYKNHSTIVQSDNCGDARVVQMILALFLSAILLSPI